MLAVLHVPAVLTVAPVGVVVAVNKPWQPRRSRVSRGSGGGRGAVAAVGLRQPWQPRRNRGDSPVAAPSQPRLPW